jgi:membrane protein
MATPGSAAKAYHGTPTMNFAELWATIKETASDWVDDKAARLAAALAYYALLSLAPLLVISVAVVGLFFGPDAAKGRVAGELGGIVGGEAAQGIQTVVANAQSPSSGVVSTIVGILTLFIGASGVFGELQASLNTVWEVQPKPGRGILGELKDRFLSFTMVLGVAFLLLVSLVLTSVLSAVGTSFSSALPGGEALWQVINFVFSLAVVTGLFALIFKYVPDAQIRWKDVWMGAAVTAVLFTLGKFLLGLYLGKAAVGSAYGAAGSIIALVVWVYYATQILLVGAEFTQVQARRRGREIAPSKNAVRAPHAPSKSEPTEAKQGA